MVGWYVMHSKPQKEHWLYKQLQAHEVNVYYPCVRITVGNLCPIKVKPFFPGYLFVNVDLEQTGISVLQWIPGSLGLVSFGGAPACVPDSLLQRIRRHVDDINGAQQNILDTLHTGDDVVIHSGPFAGYEAIFCARLRDQDRVQVLLRILEEQRVKVDLQADQIRVAD